MNKCTILFLALGCFAAITASAEGYQYRCYLFKHDAAEKCSEIIFDSATQKMVTGESMAGYGFSIAIRNSENNDESMTVYIQSDSESAVPEFAATEVPIGTPWASVVIHTGSSAGNVQVNCLRISGLATPAGTP